MTNETLTVEEIEAFRSGALQSEEIVSAICDAARAHLAQREAPSDQGGLVKELEHIARCDYAMDDPTTGEAFYREGRVIMQAVAALTEAEALRRAYDRVWATKTELEGLLEAAERERANFEAQMNDTALGNVKKQDRIASLEQEVERLKVEAQCDKEYLDNVRDKAASLEQELAELKKRITTTDELMQEPRPPGEPDDRDYWKRCFYDSQGERCRLNVKVAELEREKADLWKTQQLTDNQLRSLERENAELKATGITSLVERHKCIALLEQENARLHERNGLLSGTNDGLFAENERLKAENARLREALVEERAKLIYEQMPYASHLVVNNPKWAERHLVVGKPKWVEGGNSDKQEEARRAARSSLLGNDLVRYFTIKDGKVVSPPQPAPSDQGAEEDWRTREDCPKCHTKLAHAAGIGPFCPNHDCDVRDNIRQTTVEE